MLVVDLIAEVHHGCHVDPMTGCVEHAPYQWPAAPADSAGCLPCWEHALASMPRRQQIPWMQHLAAGLGCWWGCEWAALHAGRSTALLILLLLLVVMLTVTVTVVVA